MDKNYNVIDVMKFVMAIFVVAIHTHPENSIVNPIILNIINSIYSLAVPFFFVASGFFVYNKIKTRDYEGRLKYMRSWIYRIVRLYFIWTLIYLPYAIIGFKKDELELTKCVVVYLRNVIFVSENYLSWPLWYLLALIVGGSIVYLMLKLKIKLYTMSCVALLLVFIGILIDSWCTYGGFEMYFKLFKHTRNGLFIGFPFMIIGMLISNFGCLKNRLILLILFSIGIFAKINHMVTANYIIIFAFFQLILTLNLKESVSYLNFRFASMVVYLVHMIWVGLFMIFSPTVTSILLFLMTIILSLLTSLFVLRFKNNSVIKFFFN